MNKVLLELLNMVNSIEGRPVVLFPPSDRPNVLHIRVEWVIDNHKYNLNRVFTPIEIESAVANLSLVFVDSANNMYTDIIQRRGEKS